MFARYRGKIKRRRYDYIIKNKDAYKEKVLKETIKYIIKEDIPKVLGISRPGEFESNEYLIYKDKRSSCGDIFGDFHLKDFVGYQSYNGRNKKAVRYYKACLYYKEKIDYEYFMDNIYSYLKNFRDIRVEREEEEVFGNKYELILVEVNKNHSGILS